MIIAAFAHLIFLSQTAPAEEKKSNWNANGWREENNKKPEASASGFVSKGASPYGRACFGLAVLRVQVGALVTDAPGE